MSTDLVLSRACRHLHWCAIPEASIECCRRCGYTIVVSTSGRRPFDDLYTDVHIQPRAQDTFNPSSAPQFGANSYKYQPFDYSQRRQVRVLILKAGAAIDPLRCELQTVNLQQGPVYEALSYTWADQKGDDSLCCTITCQTGSHGDRLIAITSNCESALRHYRSPREDRRLWVDAICIDQSNVMERNHQVNNMIAIFRTAVRVLVYLGDGDLELDRLLEYITSDVDGQLPQTTHILSLFRCRWFHRVWVLQEVAVAKSILVRYGSRQLTWEDLLQQGNLFIDIMADKRALLMLPPVVSYALAQTNTGSRHLQDKSDLMALLQVSRNCSCKDPRDKVYAIMGLLKDESHLALSADYSALVSSGWVFLQVAAWHISRTGSLEILSQVEGSSGITMPSWVPDWTRKPLSSLPAQYKSPEVPLFAPRIVSRNGEALASTLSDEGRIDYPLDCTLVATGKRVATVWMDHWIFGEALENEYRSTTSANDKDLIMLHPISSTKPPHWLHNPPPITKDWPAKLSIWARLLLLYPLAKSTAAEDVEAGKVPVPACIPPAFGGPCQNCLLVDAMFSRGETYNRRADFRWKDRNVCVDDEVESFLSKMYQHGTNRRLFATEHSLGLGPMDANDWDEVWFLDGATGPFVLRRVGGDGDSGDQYKLVGACYLHGVERNSDLCVKCSQHRTREPMSFTTEEQMRNRFGLPVGDRPNRGHGQQWKDRKREHVLQFQLEQQRELQLELEILKAKKGPRELSKLLTEQNQELSLDLVHETLNAKEEQLRELEQRAERLQRIYKNLESTNEEQQQELDLRYKALEDANEVQLSKLRSELDLQFQNLEKAKEELELLELEQRPEQLQQFHKELENTNVEQLHELEKELEDVRLEDGNVKSTKKEQLRQFEQRLAQIQRIYIR